MGPFIPRAPHFWLHIIIEFPASINFFLHPSATISSSQTAPLSPQVEAIIRQYAVLLFVSVLVALIFAVRDVDVTSRRVAGALSVYHLMPLSRAAKRLVVGDWGRAGELGGPWVAGVVHALCFVALLWGNFSVAGFSEKSSTSTGGPSGKEIEKYHNAD
jgi:hypothetical protein